MNKGQEMFRDFYMAMVKEGKEAEAQALLEEGFQRQDQGTFDPAYFLSVKDKYLALVREDKIEDLKRAMESFQGK